MEFIAVVIMLFLVESALWNLPVFQVLTQHLTPEQYTREALVAVIITFTLMMLTALGGQYVLDILGVSLEGINIGGGIIILYMGFQMMQRPRIIKIRKGRYHHSLYGVPDDRWS